MGLTDCIGQSLRDRPAHPPVYRLVLFENYSLRRVVTFKSAGDGRSKSGLKATQGLSQAGWGQTSATDVILDSVSVPSCRS